VWKGPDGGIAEESFSGQDVLSVTKAVTGCLLIC